MYKCPLCKSQNTSREKQISVSWINNGYKKILNIDTSPLFKDSRQIEQYRCTDCDHVFFLPADVTGDDLFYQQLQRSPWYYMSDKWEHRKSLEFIKPGDKVLEIGCAEGAFLKKIKEKGATAEGLELNTKAIATCKKLGLSVYDQNLEDFAPSHQGQYDVVCLYQVLEHVTNPGEMIQEITSILKPGGLIIIGVPNNDSFISLDENPILNLPPHHFGLYGEKNLASIPQYFPISNYGIYCEPLQKYHYFAYFYATRGQKIVRHLGVLGKALNKLAYPLFFPFIKKQAPKIKGHTVLAIYKKR